MNKLLHTLLCLDCKGILVRKGLYVACKKCKRKFPIENGVIDMISDSSMEDKHNFQQQDYYDKEYVKTYANKDFEWRKRYKKRLMSFLPDNKKSVVLDLASGQGYMTLAVAKKGYNVIACDIAKSGLYRSYFLAKKLGIEDRILFVAGDINKLHFVPKTFDFMILLHVLEHIQDDKKVIKTLFSSSKNECIYYIGVPLSLRYVFPLLKVFYISSDKKVGHIRRYTIDSVKALFGKKAQLISKIYTGHLVKFIGVFLTMVHVSVFDNWIENMDERELENPHWASNLTAVLQYTHD